MSSRLCPGATTRATTWFAHSAGSRTSSGKRSLRARLLRKQRPRCALSTTPLCLQSNSIRISMSPKRRTAAAENRASGSAALLGRR